ncbi:Ig-like domain-containing protein [Myroides marinus]|uniref:Ig-like domain-containing protein n=1 Tax=Myroides marinus TaxID=703342 RepID=UPI0025763B08|nr:Ig-like domain-containing protein [Myroides marinus]MDM1376777.1 Ig-like domain-containing protein [Myroides marinus]
MKVKIALLMICSFLLFNCSSDDNSNKNTKEVSISFKNKQKFVSLGQDVNLVDELVLVNVSAKDIEWSSTNPNIAPVKDGIVTGVRIAGSVIVAKIRNSEKTATLNVRVGTTSLYFLGSHDGLDLDQTKTRDIKPLLKLENVDLKDVTWTSKDTNIATVKDGIVTAVSSGEVEIIAQVKNNEELKSELIMQIKSFGLKEINFVQGFPEMKLPIGQHYKYSLTTGESWVPLDNLVWKSSNEKIAKIDQNGVVEGVSAGKVRITVTAPNGVSAYIDQEIISNVPTYLNIRKPLDKPIELPQGKGYTLQLTTIPEFLSISLFTFTSSDSSLASVDEQGRVVGAKGKRGKVTITVVSKENPAIKDKVDFLLID